MGSRNWAIIIKRMIAGFVVAYALSVAFSWATKSEYSDDNPLAVGLIGVVIYLAVSFAMSIIHGLSGLLYLWLDKGRDLQELVLSDLRSARLPAPREHHMKTTSYLAELAADQDEDAEDRVKAAALAATIATVIKSSGLFAGLAWQRAADEAVLRYSQEAPSKH